MKERETSDNLIHWDCTLKSDAQRELLFFCYRSRVAKLALVCYFLLLLSLVPKYTLLVLYLFMFFGELASVMFQAFP